MFKELRKAIVFAVCWDFYRHDFDDMRQFANSQLWLTYAHHFFVAF